MKNILLTLLSVISLSPLMLAPAYAQGVNPVEDICLGAPSASVCKDAEKGAKGDDNPLFGPRGVITIIINLLSAIAGIAAVIIIIVSGLRFITSGNNPQDVNSAREGIIYAVVGLILAILAQVIVRMFLSKI